MRYEGDQPLKERETIRQKQKEGRGNTGGQVQKKKRKKRKNTSITHELGWELVMRE